MLAFTNAEYHTSVERVSSMPIRIVQTGCRTKRLPTLHLSERSSYLLIAVNSSSAVASVVP